MNDQESPEGAEDILALIDGIESAIAAVPVAASAPPMAAQAPSSPPPAELSEDLPTAWRAPRVPEEALRSSVRPAGYADSLPPPRPLEPVPMPRKVHLDPPPRSAGAPPRVRGTTRDVLGRFRWGA